MTRRSFPFIRLAAVLLLLAAAFYGLWPIDAPTAVDVDRSYTIESPLLQTYMMLAPPGTVERIVVLGNSEYIDNEPEPSGPLGLSLKERSSVLTVLTHDDYIGQQKIQLRQHSNITLAGITSSTELIEEKGRLLGYDCHSRIEGDSTETRIHSTLRMEIETRAPRLFRWVAHRRVTAAAELRLELLENAFREVILGSGDAAPAVAEAPISDSAALPAPPADWRKRLVRS